MNLSSPIFGNGESIPLAYTKYGQNLTPPLRIDDATPGAASLVLIVDDPDAPKGLFTHWLLFNIDPGTVVMPGTKLPRDCRQGKNDFGDSEYGGPKPPSGEHRYFFTLFALNTVIDLPNGTSRAELEAAMSGHVMETIALMGTYAH